MTRYKSAETQLAKKPTFFDEMIQQLEKQILVQLRFGSFGLNKNVKVGSKDDLGARHKGLSVNAFGHKQSVNDIVGVNWRIQFTFPLQCLHAVLVSGDE